MQAITSSRGHDRHAPWPAALLAGLFTLTMGVERVQAADAAAVGRPAPALIRRQFDGQPLDLAGLRGHVVLLNFRASWCGPCRSEMPLLDALSREYRDRGVVVVGLSADDPHDRNDAVKAAAGVHYLTGLLAEAPVNVFGSPQVLPLTYIIGPVGTLGAVLSANRGPLSAGQLRAAVEVQLRPADGTLAPPSSSIP